MATYTLLSAVTTNTTSSEQAVSGYVTVNASTTGKISDMGEVAILVNDVVLDVIDGSPFSRSYPLGTVNMKIKGDADASNPITVTIHDQS